MDRIRWRRAAALLGLARRRRTPQAEGAVAAEPRRQLGDSALDAGRRRSTACSTTRSGARRCALPLTIETYPRENQTPEVETTAYLVENGDQLLIAFDARDPDPSSIRAYSARSRLGVQRRLRRRRARHVQRSTPRVRVLREPVRRADGPDPGRRQPQRELVVERDLGFGGRDQRARLHGRDRDPVQPAALSERRPASKRGASTCCAFGRARSARASRTIRRTATATATCASSASSRASRTRSPARRSRSCRR